MHAAPLTQMPFLSISHQPAMLPPCPLCSAPYPFPSLSPARFPHPLLRPQVYTYFGNGTLYEMPAGTGGHGEVEVMAGILQRDVKQLLQVGAARLAGWLMCICVVGGREAAAGGGWCGVVGGVVE